MVYVNSQKFACSSCIQGHRSSSCHHTDRPLFAIKKKGRPISQCEKCRELRRNKQLHVKCTCLDAGTSSNGSVPERSAQRKIPPTPTLPNGLRDILPDKPSDPSDVNRSKEKFASLMNPCNCKSVWKCNCLRRNEATSTNASSANQDVTLGTSQLSCQCDTETFASSGNALLSDTLKIPVSSERDVVHPLNTPYVPSRSPMSRNPVCGTHHQSEAGSDFALDLPPLTCSGDSNITPPVLPPLKALWPVELDTADADASAVASLTRCGCGSTCACPGCQEHRGAESASLSGEDCPDRCGSCVDRMGGTALPNPRTAVVSSQSPPTLPRARGGRCHRNASGTMSSIDHFHAIVAHLPPPPQNRVRAPAVALNSTDVSAFHRQSGHTKDWYKAAGLVQLPPLNCCEGRCGCAGGTCGCGTQCTGSCGRKAGFPKNVRQRNIDATPMAKENDGEIAATTGCCAGKKASSDIPKS